MTSTCVCVVYVLIANVHADSKLLLKMTVSSEKRENTAINNKFVVVGSFVTYIWLNGSVFCAQMSVCVCVAETKTNK